MCADSGWRNHMDQSPPLVSIWHLTDQEQFALGMPSMLKRDSTRCHHFNFAHIGRLWYPYCSAFWAEVGGGGGAFIFDQIYLLHIGSVVNGLLSFCWTFYMFGLHCFPYTCPWLWHVHLFYFIFWLVRSTCNFKQGIFKYTTLNYHQCFYLCDSDLTYLLKGTTRYLHVLFLVIYFLSIL